MTNKMSEIFLNAQVRVKLPQGLRLARLQSAF